MPALVSARRACVSKRGSGERRERFRPLASTGRAGRRSAPHSPRSRSTTTAGGSSDLHGPADCRRTGHRGWSQAPAFGPPSSPPAHRRTLLVPRLGERLRSEQLLQFLDVQALQPLRGCLAPPHWFSAVARSVPRADAAIQHAAFVQRRLLTSDSVPRCARFPRSSRRRPRRPKCRLTGTCRSSAGRPVVLCTLDDDNSKWLSARIWPPAAEPDRMISAPVAPPGRSSRGCHASFPCHTLKPSCSIPRRDGESSSPNCRHSLSVRVRPAPTTSRPAAQVADIGAGDRLVGGCGLRPQSLELRAAAGCSRPERRAALLRTRANHSRGQFRLAVAPCLVPPAWLRVHGGNGRRPAASPSTTAAGSSPKPGRSAPRSAGSSPERPHRRAAGRRPTVVLETAVRIAARLVPELASLSTA